MKDTASVLSEIGPVSNLRDTDSVLSEIGPVSILHDTALVLSQISPVFILCDIASVLSEISPVSNLRDTASVLSEIGLKSKATRIYTPLVGLLHFLKRRTNKFMNDGLSITCTPDACAQIDEDE